MGAVNGLFQKARAAGGRDDVGQIQEMEGMYGRSLADPVGNVWEFAWMSEDATRADGAPQPED